MKKSFNVVIATAGRPTLQRMVDSIAPQLDECDYLTIIWDCQPTDLQINAKCQVIYIPNPEPLGYWGHGSRNRWQDELPGDYLMNADDDDLYADNAMSIIRNHCVDRKLYVFQKIKDGRFVPRTKSDIIEIGNIGTPCGVYPKIDKLPDWEYFYGGDGAFYMSLAKLMPVEFVYKPIYAVGGDFTILENIRKEDRTVPCECGGLMIRVSVSGDIYFICNKCRKEVNP